MLYSREDCLKSSDNLPARSGVYAWWFKEVPPHVPVKGCVSHQGCYLLYVGIAPSKPISSQNLRSRIRTHFTGNAFGSTLRLSLGCLLGFPLQDVGKKNPRLTFNENESTLSSWMSENAFVTWICCNEPWELENEVLNLLSLPLNLKGNENHSFYDELTSIRRNARDKTKKYLI